MADSARNTGSGADHRKDESEAMSTTDPFDLQRSSMTLFAAAKPEEALFSRVLDRYCGGQRDQHTLELIAG